MASRLANLIVNVPKRKGSCYQAVTKFIAARKSTNLRKASRSCCRIPRSRSNSAVAHGGHARSYSQPAMSRRSTCLMRDQSSHRHRSDEAEQLEDAADVEAEELPETKTFYYDAPDKDRRLYESARELSSPDRIKPLSQAKMKETEVSEVETVQYELEATRPHEPVKYFDVLEHFAKLYQTRDQKMLPHLQPNNLRPFGATNTLMSPTIIKSANVIKYPVFDTHEPHSVVTVQKSSERDSDDIQRRDFSTYKSLRVKENPGYRPTSKMSKLVKSKDEQKDESEEQIGCNKIMETSPEMKKCNELIEKHRELNAKYHSVKNFETKRDNKPDTSEKYQFQKPPATTTVATGPDSSKRNMYLKGKTENVQEEDMSPHKEYKTKKVSTGYKNILPWPKPDMQTPATVRSTLPINILQSTAPPEDLKIMEAVTLGPNQKLAVPWPSYSERPIARKPDRLRVVYPPLDSAEAMKPITKGDCHDSRIHVQTRGITTDNTFHIDGGLFSNDCRLRHVLGKKEVVDSILQKSNAFKENLCSNKILSVSTDLSSTRCSSTYSKRRQSVKPHTICKGYIRKSKRKRKSLPNLRPSDCPCLRPKPPGDVNFKKLKPRCEIIEKRKPRTCEKKCDTPRADEGLKLKQRELPIIVPEDCPCVEWRMKDAPRLKRRTPRPTFEPKRVCVVPCAEQMARADEQLTVNKKSLPILKPSDCPCIEMPQNVEAPSLCRLDLYVAEPKRVLSKTCQERQEIPSRADEGLKVISKSLPRVTAADCPCVEEYIGDSPELTRLIPKPVAEPKKICPVPCEHRVIRADRNMKVEPRDLPSLHASECPQPKPTPMKNVPPLDRLDLFSPEPIKVPPKTCKEITPRADAGLKLKPRDLPMIEPADCPFPKQTLKDVPLLKKLIPKPVVEPLKICPVPCSERMSRADEGMKITSRELPTLVPADCPCPERPPLENSVPIRRLDLYVPEPKRVCPVTCKETSHRADDGLILKSRELPRIEPADCPFTEECMIDAPKLKQLIPKPVAEPKRICPVPCKYRMIRADERLKVTPRELPALVPPECPCPERAPLKRSTPLQRLDLYIPEPKRTCPRPPTCEELAPRADESLEITSKELPKFEPEYSPFLDQEMKDGPKLQKLIPKPVVEPKRVCPVPCEYRTIRADEGLSIMYKQLPPLMSSDCPCPEPAPLDDSIPLQRLDLYMPEPKRTCPRQVTCKDTPRADEGLEHLSKELPKFEPEDTPFLALSMKDAPKLEKLIPKPVIEPKKICPVPCEYRISRADEGLKIMYKQLPPLMSSDCSCPKPIPLEDSIPLQRLDLNVPEPKRVCPLTCKETARRADDGMTVKPKELPAIEPGDCPCVEECMKGGPSLKRLVPKTVQERKTVCPVPCEKRMVRADAGMEIVRRTLPVLIPSECPCPPSAPSKDAPSLTRLDLHVAEPKRVLPKTCSELTARADDSLRIDMKTLPLVDEGDCVPTDLNIFEPSPKLMRPKFRDISEPERLCIEEEYCESIPRSDDLDWEYAVPHDCQPASQIRLNAKNKASVSRQSDGLQQGVAMRRHFNTYRLLTHLLEASKGRKSTVHDHRTRGIHTTDSLVKNATRKFPKSPFKCNFPWISGDKSTINLNNHETNGSREESECFFRRPISTSNVIQTGSKGKRKKNTSQKITCGQRKKLQGSPKCPKMSLPGCPPRVRTSCKKRKPLIAKCVKQSTPYPSFSEVSDVTINDIECECTKVDYLQPRHPIIKKLDPFVIPPPHQGFIDPALEDACVRKKLGIPLQVGTAVCSTTIHKNHLRQKDYLQKLEKLESPKSEADEKRVDEDQVSDDVTKKNDEEDTNDPCCVRGKSKKKKSKLSEEERCFKECCKIIQERERVKNMTLWERIVDYFRARPDCPPPEEFKKRRLREKAEKAAAEAGLCVYDPKEVCEQKELPKVITAKDIETECADENLPDDVVQVSPEKCQKQNFICPLKHKARTNDEDKQGGKERECKTQPNEVFIQKGKHPSKGDTQKRTYSTYESLQTLEICSLLNDLIYGDEETREKVLVEAEPIIDALIDQGYMSIKDLNTDLVHKAAQLQENHN